MNNANTIRRVALVGLAATLAALAGCRGERSNKPPRQFLPDMDDQPKYKAQAESEFFADGRTMRDIDPRAVAFGRTGQVAYSPVSDDPDAITPQTIQRQRADLLRADDAYYRGVDGEGNYVRLIPASIPVSDQLLRRGRERFDIYCSVCHGVAGDGMGMVGQQWSYPIPSFHQDQYRQGGEKGQDGYLFHVIRNGVPNAPGVQPPLKMPSYADRVSERDAWAIVAYLRALQASHQVPVDELPVSDRTRLAGAGAADEPVSQEARK